MLQEYCKAGDVPWRKSLISVRWSVSRRGFLRSAAIGGVVLGAGLAATPAEAKMGQKAAAYRSTPKGNQRCESCALWRAPEFLLAGRKPDRRIGLVQSLSGQVAPRRGLKRRSAGAWQSAASAASAALRAAGLPAPHPSAASRRGPALQRPEAGLVGHAVGPFDPIAEIDVGQPGARGADDVVEDDVGAEALAASGPTSKKL